MNLHEAVDQHRADHIEEYRQTVWAKWDDAHAKLSKSGEQRRRAKQRERAERKAAVKVVAATPEAKAFYQAIVDRDGDPSGVIAIVNDPQSTTTKEQPNV